MPARAWLGWLLAGRLARRLVADALELLARAPAAAAALARDPDAAFEAAVVAAADQLGLEVDARAVRLAVAELRLRRDGERLRLAAAALERMLDERLLGGRP